MKKIIIGLLTFSSFSAFATDANIIKVETLAKKYARGEDVRLTVRKVDDGICGAEGPSYMATVAIRNYKRTINSEGHVTLKTSWTKVRTYGIPASEIKAGAMGLMAEDQCLE